MTRGNLEVIRRAHAAFNRGELEVLHEVTSADVEWGTTGAWPGIDSRYVGPGAVVRWAQDIRSVWEVFEVGIDGVLGETADRMVVTERLNGRGAGSGVEVQYRVFSVYWFRDGRIVKRESFVDRAPALEAVGLREADRDVLPEQLRSDRDPPDSGDPELGPITES